jgi:phage tail-like protein
VSNDLSAHYQVYNDMRTYWATPWPDSITAGIQSPLRYGPQDYVFDVVKGTTLTGTPYGYDAVLMRIQVPASVPNRGEMVLVRGGFGYPTTPLDGEPVFYNPDNLALPVTAQFNQQAWDKPLTEGRWYYYTLFVNVTSQPYPQPALWMAAATEKVLVPKMYGHADKLFGMIPPFYQGVDNQAAGDGQNGQLRRFLAVLGYDADYNRTLLDGILNIYDNDLAPLQFTQQVGANLGLPPESALGGARYRSLVGRLWELEGMRGTLLGLQEMIYAASNYQAIVIQGYNAVLSPDDAEFVNGVGHWLPYTNPHVLDMTNPIGPTHPPNDLYTYLQLRKYAGTYNSTGFATTLTLPQLPPEMGRGVMEIIEILVTIFPGLYGAVSNITGPVSFYPQTFAGLLAAVPPVVAGVVPNYYPVNTAGWWAGDMYTLPNAETTHWNGTAWVAGPGTVTRPTLGYVNAGAPAWMFPMGALPPANIAALNTGGPSISNVHPPVAWKSGDYVQLQDGTTWHLEYQTVGGHPGLFWVAGIATLTIPATMGALGPISGYNPKWQVADGSPAIAPPDLTTLRSTVPMITGRAQSNIPDRPWNPAQSYEMLYLYDSTRVSWVGQFFGPPGGTGTYLTTRDVVNINTQRSAPTGGTGTAWVDAGAIAAGATATNKMLGSHVAAASSSPGGTITLPAGWNRTSWPADVFAPSGVAWTNVAGDGIGWQPASNVTLAEFNVMFIGGIAANTPVLAGTIIALFIGGVEHSRSTADGIHPILAHLTNASVLAGQVCEIRIWCPSSQDFYTTTTPTYSYATYPFWRIAQSVAIPATSGVWKSTVAGHFSISAILTPSTADYTGMQPFWVMKNRLTIASGYLNNDNGELCRITTDTDIAVNDIVYVALQRNYIVSVTQRLSNLTYSPGLVLARWEVV